MEYIDNIQNEIHVASWLLLVLCVISQMIPIIRICCKLKKRKEYKLLELRILQEKTGT